jgi:hypothetical protein
VYKVTPEIWRRIQPLTPEQVFRHGWTDVDISEVVFTVELLAQELAKAYATLTNIAIDTMPDIYPPNHSEWVIQQQQTDPISQQWIEWAQQKYSL